MDKPPTNAKPSAEAEHAPDELDARLLQLAEDYAAAFHRKPSEEKLQLAQLLRATGESPDLRRKLHEELTSLLNDARGNFLHAWQRWFWVEVIPAAVEGRDGDPEAVARGLIRSMPIQLRAKCPDYPTNEPELKKAVALVVAEENFTPELKLWRKCRDLDQLAVARAVLRGCGMNPKDAKSLTRKKQWDEWLSRWEKRVRRSTAT
jgi:hypothetical protein